MPDAMILKRFCLPVTLRCNLRCALCAERSPYYRNPYHPSLADLAGDVDSLFRIADSAELFDLTGGEPFLRGDLPEFINRLDRAHRQRIGRLRVTTNGTLPPPAGFAEAARAWGDDALVIIDDYHVSGLSGQVADSLRLAGVPCEIRDYRDRLHCEGWVDYGDFSRKHDSEGARRLFEACLAPKLGFFTCLANGILFPCARARLLREQGIADVSLDCRDPGLSESGKRARLRTLLGEEAIEACKYCCGLRADSPRFYPAAQLKAERPPAPGPGPATREHGALFIGTVTFNNEKTIARTLESVLAQTNGDFTHFIMNNGSTDGTGDIIRDFAARDRRIIPLGCERNDILGALLLPRAMHRYGRGRAGAFRCLLDGDDALRPEFCETILRLGRKHDPDMIVPGFRRINAVTGEVLNTRAFPGDALIRGGRKAEEFRHLRPMLLCQWGKTYSIRRFRRLPSHQPFSDLTASLPDWHYQRDTIEILANFSRAETAVFTEQPLYDYYVHPDSACNRHYPSRLATDRTLFRVYRAFLEQFGPVSKLNQDYLFAIYMSLLEDSLRALLRDGSLGAGEKLGEMLKLLRAGETADLFSRDADPQFRNLAERGRLLREIDQYASVAGPGGGTAGTVAELRSELAALTRALHILPKGK